LLFGVCLRSNRVAQGWWQAIKASEAVGGDALFPWLPEMRGAAGRIHAHLARVTKEAVN
jgi:hypothetical protein